MSKKDLNFEINILPILDILSVLICFLLLTAVWVQIGTIDTHQVVGDKGVSSGKNPPSIWISMDKNGSVTLSMRDLPKKIDQRNLESQIPHKNLGINWDSLNTKLQAIRNQWPDLKTGIVRPSPETPYKDVIKLMDQLKHFKFDGVGLSPLG
jgi:biopolymer transport protein TolR